ncbi:MAG: glycosyltransferase family 4 protein [Candidatus Omnitrophota bacterium]
MKVCHIITKPELGGAQLSTLSLLKNLPKDKYELSIITSSRGTIKDDFERLLGVKVFMLLLLVRHINPILDILVSINIWLIYITHKYDIVHTHSSKAGILGRFTAKLAGVQHIYHTVHGWPFNDYQNLFIKKVYILLERICSLFTEKIICVSNSDIDLGLKHKIAPKEKFILIKYGIDLARFKNNTTDVSSKRRELGILNNDPIVGMISCLKPQKSPQDYIKASLDIYKNIDKVNFLLIGDGRLRPLCEKLLKDSSLDVRFKMLGWRRDIKEIIDLMDISILTSKWEGLPMAVIESLVKGCVVVATDTGGVRELVRDGETGFITKKGNPSEIASRVVYLLKDIEQLDAMKNKAKASMDDSFCISRMVKDTDLLYRGVN